MKIDPYKHKEIYLKWKESVKEGISEINKDDSDIILRYLNDMERGINIASSSAKGGRGYPRLNTLRNRMILFSKIFAKLFNSNLINVNEEQLIGYFSDMNNGIIKKENGEPYTCVDTYVRIFKSFWHWHQKTNRKRGVDISDITLDLDTRQDKPKWVYLDEEQVKWLVDSVKPDYKALILFIFDTGIRSPTELINVRVSDLFNDFKELNIREETSKTFGRRIKLMVCSDALKDYVKRNGLNPEDQVFDISPQAVNKYLKRAAVRLFGDKISPAGAKYSDLSMYDFRHISCCYWLPRYKSESALKYRFGWKKSDKIHYYSELLGMKDTISEDDLLVDVTKTEIEKRLERSEKEKEIMQERFEQMERQMQKLIELTKIADAKVELLAG